MEGLGLLSMKTVFQQEKATHQIQAIIKSNAGWLSKIENPAISGYEIHMGVTELHGLKP